MANNIASLADKLDRARTLCQMESTPEFNQYVKNVNNDSYTNNTMINENGDFYPDIEYSLNAPKQSSQSNPMGVSFGTKPFPTELPSEITAKLPKSILESIKQNPMPVSSSLMPSTADSGVEALMNHLKSTSPQMQQMGQNKQQQSVPKFSEYVQTNNNQAAPQVVTSAVDYSLVKTIVEDIVKKYSIALKKNILAETKNITQTDNTGQVKLLKIGKSFQFLDDDGNIYEAVLKYKGNVNDKKKTTI